MEGARSIVPNVEEGAGGIACLDFLGQPWCTGGKDAGVRFVNGGGASVTT